MNHGDTLSALTDKVTQLRQQFPNRRILVGREGFAAVFERCEIGKQGVVITATPIDGGSNALMISWHPADYYLLVEAIETPADNGNGKRRIGEPVVEFAK